MKSIEEIKYDKELEPYFVWYLKANMKMQKVFDEVQTNHLKTPPKSAEVIVYHEKSSAALIEKLKKIIPVSKLYETLTLVSIHYLETIGYNKILESTPELLVIQAFQYN